ncbi:hypothetical protein L1887_31997 [Cichorium endivia]|nr:hypothetical protein L1887_31997 [Cichorium endivia]
MNSSQCRQRDAAASTLHGRITCNCFYSVSLLPFANDCWCIVIPHRSPMLTLRKIHSAHFWDMCLTHLYRTYEVPIPEAVDEIPLMISPFKGYTPKYDPILVDLRKLPQAFLDFDDKASTFMAQYLTLTQNA